MTVTDRKARFHELSRPRGLHPDYKKDRVSVYWVDRLPMRPSNGRTKPNLSARQEELVRPKRGGNSADAYCDPMWPVSQGAMTYEPSPRIYDLARHKSPPSQYQPRRPAQTKIPSSALTADPTPRVEDLARPKAYNALPIVRPSRWDWGDWEDRIPASALKARITQRVETLATPKSCPPSFRPARSCMWPVTSASRSVEPTERVLKLSMPRARTMIIDDYDPYIIRKGALRANITPRVEELAVALPRKSVTK